MRRYISLLLFIGLAWGQSDVDPEDADAYYNLGIAYDEQGNYTKAIESYEKAIELKPDYADAYINLGNAYNDQGNPELQISNYKEAARLGHQAVQDWLKENGYDWKITIVGKIAVIYLNNGKELEGEIIADKKNKYIMIKMEGREKKIKYNKIDYVRFGE